MAMAARPARSSRRRCVARNVASRSFSSQRQWARRARSAAVPLSAAREMSGDVLGHYGCSLSGMGTREKQLLDAAITVLGGSGMRRLTHRAVDAAAGLPVGSTSNRFRTRDALLAGVLRRILERETSIWASLAAASTPTDIDSLAEVLGRLVRTLTGDERQLSQARRAAFAQVPVAPAVGAEIQRAQNELTSWMGPALVEIGSRDPWTDVRHLLALIEGLISLQLANPAPGFDPAAALAALLRGLLREHRPTG